MQDFLRQETDKLARSWMQHDPAHLRDYLVAGVEDPRINLQSILSRQFLLRAIVGGRCHLLMEQECRFGAVMNWLIHAAAEAGTAEAFPPLVHALKQQADNAEGLEIPEFVGQTFSALPAAAGEVTVPNYIEAFLAGTRFNQRIPEPPAAALNTFCELWNSVLAATPLPPRPPSVLEPACGSANDYRFLNACGIVRHIDYTGFDLCAKNVENARALFPGVRFGLGNVFEIDAPDRAFDFCFAHDLLEHLSPEALPVAVNEMCRVTRQGLCVGFFNMDEIAQHIVNPVDDYHWNTLSMARMRELFAASGFGVQVIHIGTFLRRQFRCHQTHNPNAYTFLVQPEP